MTTTKIKRITKKGVGRVMNLTVKKNHTFITENGIPTHNCDHMSPQAQAALRNLIESTYNTARFILTANFPKKIIEPLHSRLQTYVLEKPDVETVAMRIFDILEQEQVQVPDEEELIDVIKKNSKDVRKLIQILQQNTVIDKDGNNVLTLDVVNNETDVLFETFLDLFFERNNYGIRDLIYKKFTDSDLETFWDNFIDYIIHNNDEFEEAGFATDNIIYYLGHHQYLHNFVANKHLNVLALTETLLQETE